MSRLYDAMKRASQADDRQLVARSGKDDAPTVALVPAGGDLVPGRHPEAARRLLALPRAERPRVIVVVGVHAGCGASTVARDLASALGRGGARRVLLVDANLYRPSQHEMAGVTRGNGLSEILARRESYEAAVRRAGESFSLLTSGRPVSEPSALIEGVGMNELVERLRADYDYVIFDAPSASEHPDSAILAGHADASMLVVESDTTRKDEALAARQVLEASGVPIMGVVLNRRKSILPKWLLRWLG